MSVITLPPFAYKVAYALLRLYWLVFRPEVRGVRCLMERDGRVLLIRHTYGDERWQVPGGGARRGETFEEAARREAEEEVGLRLSDLRLFAAYVQTDKGMRDNVRCFHATVAPGSRAEIRSGEVREARWFALESLPHDLSPDARRVLDARAPVSGHFGSFPPGGTTQE